MATFVNNGGARRLLVARVTDNGVRANTCRLSVEALRALPITGQCPRTAIEVRVGQRLCS